jgi:hypothetical protein
MMHRSILALTALVAFAIGSSVAYADCAGHVASTTTKQTVASADGMSPIRVPTSGDGN